MKQLKRWSTSIAASFDWIVNQVENHGAVVASAIREMQEAAVKARVQLKRVQNDGEKLRERLRDATEKETAWKQRALKLRESDREKALECLRRQKQAARDIEHFTKELKKHEQFEAQLQRDLKTVNDRIEQLKRKRNEMNAREFRADAVKVSDEHGLSLVSEIDDIFDRWEVKVAQAEVFTEPIDAFEDDFQTEEDNIALEAELDELHA